MLDSIAFLRIFIVQHTIMNNQRLNYQHIYLVCPTNTGSKFWECTVEGVAYTVRFGARDVARPVQTQSKEFESHEKAVKEMQKKVADKRNHGYAKTIYD
jgi:predicted DNA-binding WGR domain protein